MTPDKARKLIEEAHEAMENTEWGNIKYCRGLLTEALTLLPQSTPSDGWQEFDPEREETWPKDDDEYFDQAFRRHRWHKDYSQEMMWAWKVEDVKAYIRVSTISYQPLPPPYQKP